MINQLSAGAVHRCFHPSSQALLEAQRDREGQHRAGAELRGALGQALLCCWNSASVSGAQPAPGQPWRLQLLEPCLGASTELRVSRAGSSAPCFVLNFGVLTP